MSPIAVTDVVPSYISKDGKCIYCGSQLRECLVCSRLFAAGKADNEICSTKCRTRRHRQKIRDELELDDE
jgi:predicted nucleic acid-binding Zn ribbon protein